MNQVLSQSEVDALLAAVSDGDVATSEAPKSDSQVMSSGGSGRGDDRKIVSYDLTSQDRIIRGRLPQLEVIYEKFMRAFRVSLSSALRKIASITLKNNNSIVQKIKFDYDMFSSNNVGMNSFSIPISRPFLKSVTFQDQSPEGSSSYLLDYFNPEMIPQRFSYAQDLLGYYNGKNNSNFIFNSLLDYDNLPEYELVSPNKVDFSNLIYRVTADRKPNIDVAKNGTLKKITYPTKGYTNFNYEGNLTNNREIIYPPYTMGTIDLPHKPNTVSGSHYKEIFITSPFDQKLYIGLAMNNTDIPQCDTHESSSLGISENGIPLDFYHLGNLGQTGNIGTASNFEMGYFDYFNEESQERLYRSEAVTTERASRGSGGLRRGTAATVRRHAVL